MTSQSVRAVYHAGNLRLLEPLDLAEGEEVSLVIMTEKERARAALRDILVDPETIPFVEGDEEELMRSIREAFKGSPPLSEAIIEERRTGP
jgi:predicted DNA-binding antitoxin AbrB/MazE fold protein